MEHLEDMVFKTIHEKILSEEAIEYLQNEMRKFIQEHLKNANKHITSYQQELVKVESQIKNFVKAIGEGCDLSEIREELEKNKRRKGDLEKNISRIKELERAKTQSLEKRILAENVLEAKRILLAKEDGIL